MRWNRSAAGSTSTLLRFWVIENVSIVEAKSSVVVVWEDDMSSSARVVKNVLLSYNFLSLQ